MRTIEVKLYTFNELSEEAKNKALEKLAEINVNYEWYEYIYEDAKSIGLNITEFDVDYRYNIEGKLTEELPTVVKAILANHGDTTDTYTLAMQYKNKHGDDNEDKFLKELLQCYFKMLQDDYRYLTSEEAIIETILANEYEFLDNGKLA